MKTRIIPALFFILGLPGLPFALCYWFVVVHIMQDEKPTKNEYIAMMFASMVFFYPLIWFLYKAR